jgi:myxalamid-type polyketide synthase MxaE and MxaD
MDLRNRLERLLSRQLPASLAWNYPTIEALAEYLSAPADSCASSNGAPPAVNTGNGRELAGVSPLLEGLNDWSDDDVLRELRGGR